MTPQEFEKQLSDLLKNAPEECTFFLTFSSKEANSCIQTIQGTPISLIADLTLLACKNTQAKMIIDTTSKMADNPLASLMSKHF